MKITGATDSDSLVDRDGQWQPSGLLVCKSVVENKEGGENRSTTSDGASTALLAAVVPTTGVMSQDQTPQAAGPGLAENTTHTLEGTILSGPSGDDEDLLDLLVDTLDGEFDPDLLI